MKLIDERSGNQSRSPQVVVSFSDYDPPFDPLPIVCRMLDSVPPRYLVGLDTVVLANASGLSRKRRNAKTKSRKRKVGMAGASGLYHPASRGNSAWIEIFMDNTLRGWDKGWWLRIPLVREGKLSDVLFHEIGHHVHRTVRPEHREREDVADVWKVRLQRNYYRQRFSWLGAIGRAVRPLFGGYLDRLTEKVGLGMFKRGQISRAEYLDSAAKKRTRGLDES